MCSLLSRLVKITLISLLALLGAAACSDDDNGGKLDTGVDLGADKGVDSTAPDQKVAAPDTTPDTKPGPDLGQAKQLTSSHSGWKKALCFDCHDGTTAKYTHAKDTYKAPDCGPCHGYNGAPHKDHATKANGGCTGCHSASSVPHVAKFTSPDDCVGCHFHP